MSLDISIRVTYKAKDSNMQSFGVNMYASFVFAI